MIGYAMMIISLESSHYYDLERYECILEDEYLQYIVSLYKHTVGMLNRLITLVLIQITDSRRYPVGFT